MDSPNNTISSTELLRQLSEAHGAPGSEGAVRQIFTRLLASHGSIRHDRLGSAICERHAAEGSPDAAPAPRVMLTAHFDEVGFAVQSITKRGYLKIVALGGWWTHNLLAQAVTVLTRSGRVIPGVISATPPHFLTEGQRDKVLSLEQLFVDVGAESDEQVLRDFAISLGDPIVPATEFSQLANPNLVMGKAFDNRVGCAVMIETMRRLRGEALECDLVAVGTVQEEIGCRGAITAAAAVTPDVAIILEGAPADDAPGMDLAEAQGVLGKGPQLRLLDPTALMSRPLVRLVEEVAAAQNIPVQLAVRRSGGTDAKSIHLAGQGVPCLVMAVPARFIPSHHSVLDLRFYESTIRLCVAVCQALNPSNVAALTNW